MGAILKIVIIILLANAGVLLLVFLISTIVFFSVFRKKDDKIFDEIDLSRTHYAPYVKPLYKAIKRMREEQYKRLHIISADGKKLYANYYYRGHSKTAIMVHGYRSNPFNNFSVIGTELLDRGYNVLFLFQRSHGDSEGRFITMGLKESADVLKWIDLIALDENITDILVYGTSMGGATVGYLSDRITTDKVKLLTVDCAFTSFYGQLKALAKMPFSKLLTIGFPVFWLLARVFLGVNIAEKTTKHIAGCHLPICFIHGEADDWVPLTHTMQGYNACPGDKKLITIPKAGHTSSLLVGDKEARAEYFEFVEKYIK